MFSPFKEDEAYKECLKFINQIRNSEIKLIQVSKESTERDGIGVMIGVLICLNQNGKEIVLKTISGILKPYKGSVQVNGTISPLIELGAGFDGNLTARENIFLNGAVLGYSEKFLKEKCDEMDMSEDIIIKNIRQV